MYIYTIDIAHPPLSSNVVEEMLDDLLVQSRRKESKWRVIKIVHGYGSSSGTSVLKETVRNWSYTNRKRILAVIPGEEYSMFDPKTIKMRKTCGQVSDSDLGTSNPGITMIWIK